MSDISPSGDFRLMTLICSLDATIAFIASCGIEDGIRKLLSDYKTDFELWDFLKNKWNTLSNISDLTIYRRATESIKEFPVTANIGPGLSLGIPLFGIDGLFNTLSRDVLKILTTFAKNFSEKDKDLINELADDLEDVERQLQISFGNSTPGQPIDARKEYAHLRIISMYCKDLREKVRSIKNMNDYDKEECIKILNRLQDGTEAAARLLGQTEPKGFVFYPERIWFSR